METRTCPECGAVNTCDRDICFKCEELLIEKPVETVKKKGSIVGTLVNAVVGIFIVMVFMAFAIPQTSGRPSKSARQKACIANMKYLENAFEMYDMDTPPAEGSSYTTIVCRYGAREPVTPFTDTLQNGGYVQRMPLCPSTGSLDAYSVYRDSAQEYVIRVDCSVHGTISNPRK